VLDTISHRGQVLRLRLSRLLDRRPAGRVPRHDRVRPIAQRHRLPRHSTAHRRPIPSRCSPGSASLGSAVGRDGHWPDRRLYPGGRTTIGESVICAISAPVSASRSASPGVVRSSTCAPSVQQHPAVRAQSGPAFPGGIIARVVSSPGRVPIQNLQWDPGPPAPLVASLTWPLLAGTRRAAPLYSPYSVSPAACAAAAPPASSNEPAPGQWVCHHRKKLCGQPAPRPRRLPAETQSQARSRANRTSMVSHGFSLSRVRCELARCVAALADCTIPDQAFQKNERPIALSPDRWIRRERPGCFAGNPGLAG